MSVTHRTFTPLARLRWLREARTPSPLAFAVLAALVAFSDEDGRCYPSQDTLATITGMSLRSARKAMKELEASGLLVRRRRIGREGRSSDEIALRID